jgi:hypothetical protein
VLKPEIDCLLHCLILGGPLQYVLVAASTITAAASSCSHCFVQCQLSENFVHPIDIYDC